MSLEQWFFKSKENCVYKTEEFQDFLDKDNAKESCVYKTEELLDEGNTEGKEKYLHLPEDAEQFFYFRKNKVLNEWICNNLATDDIGDFNCIPIEILENNVLELFNAIVKGDLSSKFKYQNEELLSLIKKLFQLFSEDKDIKIYYYAWW